LDEVEYATLEWVDWFNHRRLLEPIGHIPPAEFEAAYHQRGRPQRPCSTQAIKPPVNPGRFNEERSAAVDSAWPRSLTRFLTILV